MTTNIPATSPKYTLESLQNILDTTAEQLGYRKVPVLHKGEDWGWYKWLKLTQAELAADSEVLTRSLDYAGQPIWISEAKFHLVPNEHTEAAIRIAALKRGAEELSPGTGTRWGWGDRGPWQWYGYFHENVEDAAGLGPVQKGFWVANSMDGSLGLTFGGIANIYVDGQWLHDRFTVYSHRHTANVLRDPVALAVRIDNALSAVTEWAKYLVTLKGENPRNAMPVMERLATIPMKYTPEYLHYPEDDKDAGLNPNLFPEDLLDVWEDVLRGLASAQGVREDTILGHHDKLHGALEYLAALKALKVS